MVLDPVALEGAVYVAESVPEDVIVPTLACHVTVGSKLPVPCTVAWHCVVWPSWTVEGEQVGLTEVMVPLACTVRVNVPLLVASLLLVAFTVTVVAYTGAM